MKLAAHVAWLLACLIVVSGKWVKGADVTARFSVTAFNGRARPVRDVSIVAWLTPVGQQTPLRAAVGTPHARLLQRNKTFDPHVVVVQVGSAVDFPNRDPFFHNVFSLFNGKRFDLGLYESGSTRSVRFDRSGVCYIFCNIHPQMSAVVVVVETPYFASSDGSGRVQITGVPSGRYNMDFWEERSSAEVLRTYSRQVTVGNDGVNVGAIAIKESMEPATAHLNKYGKQYDPDALGNTLYTRP